MFVFLAYFCITVFLFIMLAFVKYRLVAAMLFCSPLLSKAGNTGNLESFTNSAPLEGAIAGVAVIDMDNGTVVAACNEHVPLVPASLQKLVVTSSALKCYSPDKKFVTRIEYSGNVTGGVLDGALVVRGCGDPSLGSAFGRQKPDAVMTEILTALKGAGINRIDGDIIADDSHFSFQGVQPSWLMEDIGNYFAAGCYGINFSDNLYQLHVKSGGTGSRADITRCVPAVPGLVLNGCFIAEGTGRDSAYITGLPFVNERFLSGRVPVNRNNYVVKGDIPDPALFFACSLKEFLEVNGIVCNGDVATARIIRGNGGRLPDAEGSRLLCSHFSDRLSDMVRVTNFRSNNLYAESLIRWVGEATGTGCSVEGGANAVVRLWKDVGVEMDGIRILDGCGLSLRNRISAGTLASILAAIGKDDNLFRAFLSTMPEAGKEGTVKSFLAGTPLAGKVWAKSGSMNGVQCYAGYCNNGRRMAFAVMVNGFSSDRREVRREIERLLLSLLTGE